MSISSPMRFAIATSLALAAMSLAAAPARSYDDYPGMNCHDYAQWSIHQQRENADFYCGFSGSRWSSSYDFHFTRCVRGDVDPVYEYRARRAALASCTASTPPPPPPAPIFVSKRCVSFAKKSVKLYRKNLQLGCGLWGEEWHADEARHARWCAAGNEPFVKDILRGRKIQLKRCKSGRYY